MWCQALFHGDIFCLIFLCLLICSQVIFQLTSYSYVGALHDHEGFTAMTFPHFSSAYSFTGYARVDCENRHWKCLNGSIKRQNFREICRLCEECSCQRCSCYIYRDQNWLLAPWKVPPGSSVASITGSNQHHFAHLSTELSSPVSQIIWSRPQVLCPWFGNPHSQR